MIEKGEIKVNSKLVSIDYILQHRDILCYTNKNCVEPPVCD